MIRGTDALPGTLQDAGERLAEAEQTSESAKLAARDLAKALGRPEFLSHKDKVGAGQGGGTLAAGGAGSGPAPACKRRHRQPPGQCADHRAICCCAALLQEVRLYTALCLCHILRLNAPDTPYTDGELQVGKPAAQHSSCMQAGAERQRRWVLRPLCSHSESKRCCCCRYLALPLLAEHL